MNYQTATLTTAKTTDGNELPVSLQEAKNHLDLVNDDRDDELSAKLAAALDYCERVTGRSLRVSHTIVQSYSKWPCNPLRFDWNPVHAISHVKYYDADNTLQTVSSSDYRLNRSNAACGLEFDQSFTYPTPYSRSDAVQVTYLAGYAAISDVPAAAKNAVLLAVEKDWGNLLPAEVPRVERSLASLLASVDTGAYR